MIGRPLCGFQQLISVVPGECNRMRTLALLLLLLVVYATPSAGQACPFGAAFCNGRHGAGCYDPICNHVS